MLEPLAPRQALGVRQGAFALQQLQVYLRQRSVSHRRPAVAFRPCVSALVVIGALIQRVHRVLQRSEIEMRRNRFRCGRHFRLARI